MARTDEYIPKTSRQIFFKRRNRFILDTDEFDEGNISLNLQELENLILQAVAARLNTIPAVRDILANVDPEECISIQDFKSVLTLGPGNIVTLGSGEVVFLR